MGKYRKMDRYSGHNMPRIIYQTYSHSQGKKPSPYPACPNALLSIWMTHISRVSLHLQMGGSLKPL
jgi:hypothetical protein